jgi:hypothetical protein
MNKPVLFSAALAVALVGSIGAVRPADLKTGRASAGAILFAPSLPNGVVADFPRSPLTDFAVNGFARFDNPGAAQAYCPRDTVVWAEFGSGEYRLVSRSSPQNRGYGAYLCQADASAEGDRLAH